MTELKKFNSIWKFEGQRAKQTQEHYESILFSIWKHHREEEEKIGFQIKCFDNRTIYKVVELALKSGLLIKTKNYSVGHHTRLYQKNLTLFDLVFRNAENKFGNWLDLSRTHPEIDIIHCLLREEFNKLNEDNNYDLFNNISYVAVTSKSTKAKKLNYDLGKLKDLTDKMFPHYYKLLQKLNRSVIHSELKFISFIHFNPEGLPSGRPYSTFCSTLNPEKSHKKITGEFRDDFLKNIGLPDYYEVYDIKSEIPRVNYLFHTGEWKDDSYDFYSEIIKDTKMLEETGEAIARGSPNDHSHYNDSMKQLFMRIYFGKGSDIQAWNGYLKEKLPREKLATYKNNKEIIIDKKNYDWYFKMLDNGEGLDFKLWQTIYASTRKICGPSIHNLIFWYSFFIETEVKIELLKRGKKVYNVYDGFYYNQDIKDEIKDILKIKAMYVYNKYMKPIQKK
ncbi:hypothetical protein FACS1894147_10160 [Spirochaetia bacterium]|nr:hypothetical protein FACS1894147_10090 [Spirochaetia bacterium]GHU04727.1 hypothetical protein FACS1894147_10160 [Spirochaetia bacterium]